MLSAQKQQLKFDHLTTENGLPQEHVFCILQDHRGFLWLGMETGLARYDGYTFKTYRHDPADTTSISSNIIRALYQDESGMIWVGTDGGGLCRFDPRTETFATFKYQPQDPGSLSGNRIYGITQDRTGALWVATLGDGLNRIVFDSLGNGQKNLSINRFQADPANPFALAEDNIWTIYLDRRQQLWIGTVGGGLDRLDLSSPIGSKPEFQHYRHQPAQIESISDNSIKAIFEDHLGMLWVGTEYRGLNRLDPASGKFKRFLANRGTPGSLSHNYVSSILEDDDQNLWIGTNGGGLNLYDPETESFAHYQHLAGDPYSLNGQLVNTIFQDRSGIIWVGMVTNGLNRMDPQKQQIRHFYAVPFQTGSLTSNLVKSIYEDRNGAIWVGTYGGGLSRFYPELGTFQHYRQVSANDTDGSNNVQRIYEDRQGNFWIGTDGGGLYLFDRERKTFRSFNLSPSGKTKLTGNSVWTICEDLRGNLWIGTADGGLNCFRKGSQEFEHFPHDAKDPNSINGTDVRIIYEDHLGILWIGTYDGGLNRMNPADGTFIRYTNFPEDSTSISNNIITDIFESPSDRKLWIGTFGGGLNLFDRVSTTFTHFRESNGLANDVVKSIEEDQDGHLWISTLKGISKFDPGQQVFINYTSSDGLQGPGFNLGSSCVSEDGALFFGGTNGLNYFFPEKLIKLSKDHPECLITDLRIFNRSIKVGEKIGKKIILDEAIEVAKEITIPYDIDDFTFEFSALDFASSDKIRYAYQLEGNDNGWQYTGANRRYASYTHLPGGKYVFKVRASNKDGQWNEQITRLTVHRLSPPWKSPLAIAIYVVLILLAVYLLRKYTIARLKLLNELKLERLERKKNKELNEMKLRFFTNISHEIRTPLSLILGPIQSLITQGIGNRETRNQLQIMNRNANRLLILVNQLLEFRAQEAGHSQLKVAKGNIIPFLSEISMSFRELARQRDIQFTFEPGQDRIELWFDRNQMEKVFYNLLSNAFKFTPDKGQIRIGVSEGTDDTIVLEVEDNGQGIPSEELPYIFDRFHKFNDNYSGNYLGSGIGLALVKNIVSAHHGEISVESQPNEYTRFTIRLPKGVQWFREDQIIADFKESEDPIHYKKATLEAEQPHEVQPQTTAPSDAPRLLLVEDNEDVRQYLKEIFVASHRILEATNGKEGWELAKKVGPDLIISDIMMPEMDGIELCQKIKTSLETSHIPIILLTARTSLVYQFEGLETGADDYITKPFNPDLLKLRVRNIIESRQKLRSKFSQQIAIEPQEIALTSPDQELLKNAIEAVEKHMDNGEFDVNQLARELGLSRPVLYRKLPAITNHTPNEFIRIIRLKRAAQILSKYDLPISEVCYSTGFKTPKYFSKCFRELFGKSPSEYVRDHRVET